MEAVDSTALKSPIIECEIFKKEMVDAFIETQKNRQLISNVNQLFAQGQYNLVKDVLLANLEVSSNQLPTLTQARVHHLLMMVESLWHLKDYGSTLAWIEQAIHELMRCRDPDIKDIPTDLLNMLKTLECCIVMTDGNLGGVEDRPRLASNLLKMVLLQVDGDEECGLGEKTVLPWVLLYHLIVYEETLIPAASDDIPSSLSFLCSAHDYLGPLSLCTMESGKLLTLQVTAIVDTLFKGVTDKTANDQLCRNMDQALFCLYAHPSKKSKARHLVDHGISNIAFTWERCLKPYVYLRPRKLPEFDDLKSASIISETVIFFKRIVALVPDRFRIHKRAKRVKDYLMDSSQKKFPNFESEDESSDDSIIMVGDDANEDKPFPPAMIDLFYLLADHYMKNSDFKSAIDNYLIDIAMSRNNQNRKDSWISLSLAMYSQLEAKINESDNKEMNNDILKQILAEAQAIRKCFLKSIELIPNSITIRIGKSKL